MPRFRSSLPIRCVVRLQTLYLFIFNIIGFGLGPTVVALFTDYDFGAESQIGYSLSSAAVPLSCWERWLSGWPKAFSIAQARSWI